MRMTLGTQRFTLSGLNLAILLTLSHAANDAFTNVLPVFLPIFQERFNLGEAVLASFVAVISLSSNVLQAFMGALADRWGKRRSAALGLVLGSILMSFVAVAPTVWMLFILLAVGGLGSAIFHPAASSMARNVSSKTGLSMGFFISGGSLGSALMPIVALAIIRNYGTQYVPYLALVGIVIGALLFFLSPEQEVARGASRPKIFDSKLFFGPVGILSLVGIMRAITFIGFTNALPLWLVNTKGFAPDAQLIGWTLGVYSIASSVGVMSAGALEQKLGRGFLIAGTMLLALPALLVLFVVAPGSLLYYALVAVIGILTNASVPLLVVTAQDLAPHAVATASGMLMGFTWGVAGVLYIGFGALQESIGLSSAMIFSYLFLIPAALLSLWVMRKYGSSPSSKTL